MSDFLEEIECELMELPEYSHHSVNVKTKKGKYHGSNFWEIPQFGSKRWVVAARIKMNFAEIDGVEISDTEVAQACLNYLNKPPPRKKYAKRQPSPKYGKLELHSARVVDGKYGKFVSVLLIVKKRKSPQFWGKGKLI